MATSPAKPKKAKPVGMSREEYDYFGFGPVFELRQPPKKEKKVKQSAAIDAARAAQEAQP